MVDLDSALDALGLGERRVLVLKIDVEGYEPAVIEGAARTLARADAVVLEYSPDLGEGGGLSAGAMVDRLVARRPHAAPLRRRPSPGGHDGRRSPPSHRPDGRHLAQERRAQRRDSYHDSLHLRPPPWRRLRAACRRRRGRPRHPCRGRQRHRGHAGHGRLHRRRLSAHEPYRRRRLLADPRAVRPRARADGGGARRQPRRPPRSIARPATTKCRRAGRSPRSPCRARSPAGCWRARRRKRSCRVGGKLPLDLLLAGAIKHAREGYIVTRSQAQLTDDKLAELKDVPGFAKAFLLDGKPPEAGAPLKQTRLRRHARSSRPCRARRFLSRRCRARDRRRSGAHRQPGDARRSRTLSRLRSRRRFGAATQAGTLYNAPPPTQGLASLIILGLFDRLRVQQAESFEHVHAIVEATKRAFRVRDRVVTDPDRITGDLDRFLAPAFLDEEAAKIDHAQGRALAGAVRRRRHHLDGRGGRERPRRLLYPVALLGVRLGLRAAGDRRADAEPRRQLLARPASAQRARARPPPVPHAQPGARRAEGRPRHRLWHHGRRRPAADARPPCSPAMCCSASRSIRRSMRRAGCLGRTWGSTPHQSAPGIPLRRQSDRPADVGRPRRRGARRSLTPTPWAMPARWCCIRTARWKAATTRAPTAARRGCDLSFRGRPKAGTRNP